MNVKLFERALDFIDARKPKKEPTLPGGTPIKKVSARPLSYTERHRGQWFKPEYDLAQIQIAQDTDSFIFRSIHKKVNRFMIAGYEFHGRNPETVEYIQRRIAEMELATGQPWSLLVRDSAHDMFRYSNCMWAKVRDKESSTGEMRVDLSGQELEPVAGYFILPFETLEFKTKSNGEIKKVLQRMPGTGETREFLPKDLIFFYTNKKPGFAIGTPEILPALDDISLLRRIEENVEELIETNLFPVYHYTVGTDEIPERYGPDGRKESDIVKQSLEYMPAGGIYVSDHRHDIEVLGSESKALRIDFYLTYFKARALAGLGVSSVDMGEGDTANRSTAGTLSKALIQDVEAMQEVMKTFLEFHVINELLWEGGYDPLDPEMKVEIKFGVIDKEEQTRTENQAIQLFHGNVLTASETRKRLGHPAYKEEDFEDTYQRRFEEPLAMIGNMGPGTAASETLAKHESSNVEPEAVAKEEQFAKQQQKAELAAKRAGAPKTKTSGSGSRKASAAKARPSNQHGTRSAAKSSKDLEDLLEGELLESYLADLAKLEELVTERIQETNCSSEVVRANLAYRFDRLAEQYLARAERFSDGS